MMKILHISTPKTWRGGEQQLAYLIEKSSSNLFHTVLCPIDAELGRKGFAKDVDFEFFETHGLGKRITSTVKLLKTNRYHLIHTHDSKSHTIALLALIISKLDIPLVVSRRVDFPIGGNVLSKWKYEHNRISAILCVSETIKKICKASLQRNKGKLQTVYSGVDAEKIGTFKGILRRELNIPPQTWLVGCVAALAPHKDHLCLLKAWKEFLNQIPTNENAQLILVGEGGEREHIEHFIKENDLSKTVKLLGYRADVHQIISDFDVFALSSSTEGLGTSIIDAMFAKLPVIATKAGGIPELVQHEKNGLLCPPGDYNQFAKNLLLLYRDSNLAESMGRCGAELAQNFSAKAMAKKTEKIYASLL
ncbi:glycosyltransferase family 4 protein [Luteibaculum oceani]|nr:glycosyltransferase family 4 protein [Luteibaculum oceani]